MQYPPPVLSWSLGLAPHGVSPPGGSLAASPGLCSSKRGRQMQSRLVTAGRAGQSWTRGAGAGWGGRQVRSRAGSTPRPGPARDRTCCGGYGPHAPRLRQLRGATSVRSFTFLANSFLFFSFLFFSCRASCCGLLRCRALQQAEGRGPGRR